MNAADVMTRPVCTVEPSTTVRAASPQLTGLRTVPLVALAVEIGDITAPTLVTGGAHDACCGRALFERTATGIPNAHPIVWPRTGRTGVGPTAASIVPTALHEDAT